MRRLLPLALLLLFPAAFGQAPAERAEILDSRRDRPEDQRLRARTSTSRAGTPSPRRARTEVCRREDGRRVRPRGERLPPQVRREPLPLHDPAPGTRRGAPSAPSAWASPGRPGKEGMTVSAVAPGSPADKAKIKAGDVLLKVEGKPATREALQGEAGKEVGPALKGKKEQTLKFEPYSLRRPATLTKVDGRPPSSASRPSPPATTAPRSRSAWRRRRSTPASSSTCATTAAARCGTCST